MSIIREIYKEMVQGKSYMNEISKETEKEVTELLKDESQKNRQEYEQYRDRLYSAVAIAEEAGFIKGHIPFDHTNSTQYINAEIYRNFQNIINTERTGDMIIGRIYDKVFVPMSESSGSADEAMNERLILLIEGADIEHMTKASLTDLICKGAVIGQREGFISGVRFTARLLCNMLS